MAEDNGQPGLLAALANATKDDLGQVRGRLAALQNEVASLKEIEKILQRRFPEEEEPVADTAARIEASLQEKSERGWSTVGITKAAQDVVALLEKHRHGGQWMQIAEAGRILGKAAGSIKAMARHHRQVFEVVEGRIRIRDKSVTEQESQQQQGDDEQEAIHDYLSEAGPAKPAMIAVAVQLPAERVLELLEHEWFRKTPDGYVVRKL